MFSLPRLVRNHLAALREAWAEARQDLADLRADLHRLNHRPEVNR